jgi:hypothetical protein
MGPPPYRMKGNALSSSTSGYAYVGGACVKNLRLRKISSVAIVEDRGGYSGVIVAAHELGKAADNHKNVQYKWINKAVRKNGNFEEFHGGPFFKNLAFDLILLVLFYLYAKCYIILTLSIYFETHMGKVIADLNITNSRK